MNMWSIYPVDYFSVVKENKFMKLEGKYKKLSYLFVALFWTHWTLKKTVKSK